MQTRKFRQSFYAALALLAVMAMTAAGAADVFPSPSPSPAAAIAKPDRMAVAREAIKAKDWKKSVAELRVAVAEQPSNADAHNLLAYSYRKQAVPDLSKAFEHYNTALKINPNHKGANEYIGEAYLMSNNLVKAGEHLARLKAICGNAPCEEYEDLAKSIAAFKAKNN